MRINILSMYYPPEGSPAGKRMKALAQQLVSGGHEVRVIAPAPSYPYSQVYQGFGERWVDRRDEEGIEVVRFRPRLAPKQNILKRAIAEVRNSLMHLALCVRYPSDVVVATSPSLVLGPIGLVAARLTGRRYVWDVRDLFWLYARDLGKVRSQGLLRLVERVMGWTARRADALTTTTELQRQYFVERGARPERAFTHPNGVDDSFFEATLAGAQRPARPAQERLHLVYAGLIGYTQGLEALVEAAAHLDPARWRVTIAGDGAVRPELERRAKELGLTHLELPGYLSLAQMVALYADADVLYAQLRGLPAMQTAQPSKLLEYFAAGRPVIYGGAGTGAALMQQAGAGVVIAPDDPQALVEACERLRPERLRARLGAAGRAHVAAHGLRAVVLPRFAATVVDRPLPDAARPAAVERAA